MEIGNEFGKVAAVYGSLFIFGFIYNGIVAWLEKLGYDEGYTWLMVVFGVSITIAGVSVVDWRYAMITFGAFIASGFWMVIGSWWRYAAARKRSQDIARIGE